MLKNSDKMQNITEKKQQNLQQRCKNTSQKKVKKKVWLWAQDQEM